jgi:phage-related protein
MHQKHHREIYYYKDYYMNFFEPLKPEVKKKLNWTLQLITVLEYVPEKYFKHLSNTNGLYEIRVEVGTDIYRVFAFFDMNKLLIIGNGFQKKSQKTPNSEIERAERIRKQYFLEKNSNENK